MLKGSAAVGTLEIGDRNDVKIVEEAVCALLGRDRRARGSDWDVVDLVSRKGRTSSVSDIDLLRAEGERNIQTLFIIAAGSKLSTASAAMIDGCARLGKPDWRIVGGAFRTIMGRLPSVSLTAEMLAVIPLAAYGSAIRPRADCNRATKRLLRLALSLSPSHASIAEFSRSGPTLAELHGLGEAAVWGQALAQDLRDYREGRISWRDVDRGALVSGPPGCGKTTFAQALGRTCGVPVHVHSLAEWQSRGSLDYLLKAMLDAFASAREAAPCLLFIDEIDSFSDRSGPSNHNAIYNRQVVNALLECLDGAGNREGVVVIGATNYPEIVDEGLRRPGRLDRHIAIALPDLNARIAILRYHLVGDLIEADLVPVARRLEGASGAVLEQVIRGARRHARSSRRPLTIADLEANLPATVRLSDAAFRRSCIHEAGHLIAALLLEGETGSTPIEAVVNREVVGIDAGHIEIKRDPGFDRTYFSVLAEIVILLAGVAGERVVLGDLGYGAGGGVRSDLAIATRLLAEMELSHGLGEFLVFATPAGSADLFQLLAREPELRRRVDALLQSCLKRAVDLLSAERRAFDAIVDEFSRSGTISIREARRWISAMRSNPSQHCADCSL